MEVHITAADTFVKVFDVVEYKMILCLTATLERLDGKETLIKKHAPVVDVITKDEALENGWIAPVKEYLVLIDVDLSEYKEVNRKFNAYFSAFDYKFQDAMKCVTNWKYRTSWAKEHNMSAKDATGLAFGFNRCLKARKEFISNHPKKLEICKAILDARKNKKCIVFAPTIKLCEKIGTDFILHSGKTKKSNRETLDLFNAESKGSIGSSKALDTGVDVKGLSVGIIMNTDSSRIRTTQRVKTLH